MTRKDINNISYMAVPLPDDIQRAKEHGDIALAKKIIHKRLAQTKTSQTLRLRLEGELEVLAELEGDEYSFTEAEALEQMGAVFKDFQPSELATLLESGDVEWLYKHGEKFFQRKFIPNLVKTREDYFQRYLLEEEGSIDNARQTELDDNIKIMKAQERRKARITTRQSIQPKEPLTEGEMPLLAHIPLPRENGYVTNLQVLSTQGNVINIDEPEAIQRTIAFDSQDAQQTYFEVEHTYEISAVYQDLFAAMDSGETFASELTEEEKRTFANELAEKAPHILFTPFMESLLGELVTEDQSLLEKAFKIYEFITTKVNYSYVREYFTIPNISEFCAVNQKGDCGVQAILFITLCRLAGIPATWESGLYVSDYMVGPHDWAKFYVPEFGWLYADPSFGGSAFRGENLERWRYYFGNLDVFRMPANCDIQGAFTVAKKQLRADPIDNQRGELESCQRGFNYDALNWSGELVKFDFVDE